MATTTTTTMPRIIGRGDVTSTFMMSLSEYEWASLMRNLDREEAARLVDSTRNHCQKMMNRCDQWSVGLQQYTLAPPSQHQLDALPECSLCSQNVTQDALCDLGCLRCRDNNESVCVNCLKELHRLGGRCPYCRSQLGICLFSNASTTTRRCSL